VHGLRQRRRHLVYSCRAIPCRRIDFATARRDIVHGETWTLPKLRSYRVFMSHCWEYNDDYYALVDWLEKELLFDCKNLSVPEESAMREDKTFEKRLRKRLGDSNILLVIVGMQIARRYWVKWEINGPIFAASRWSGSCRTAEGEFRRRWTRPGVQSSAGGEIR
jgi:hypothetical protein